jgi:DNA replicative helicase MCM subunit Mcm2 (Cdc46/Mcm family)
MSYHDITTGSNGDESDEQDEPTVENLAARVRDLEADVYGYANDEESAGQQAVVDVKRTIVFLSNRQEGDDAVSVEDIWTIAEILGLPQDVAEQAFEKLRRLGEIYEPASGEVRTT